MNTQLHCYDLRKRVISHSQFLPAITMDLSQGLLNDKQHWQTLIAYIYQV